MLHNAGSAVLWLCSTLCVNPTIDAMLKRHTVTWDSPQTQPEITRLLDLWSDTEIFECPICCDFYSATELNSLPLTLCCGHMCCSGCYTKLDGPDPDRKFECSICRRSLKNEKTMENKALMALIALRDQVWDLHLTDETVGAIWILIYEILQCTRCLTIYEEEGPHSPLMDEHGYGACEACRCALLQPPYGDFSMYGPLRAEMRDFPLSKIVKKARDRMDPDRLACASAAIISCASCGQRRLKNRMYVCQVKAADLASFGNPTEFLFNTQGDDTRMLALCSTCAQEKYPTAPQMALLETTIVSFRRLREISRELSRLYTELEERNPVGEELFVSIEQLVDGFLGETAQLTHTILIRELIDLIIFLDNIKTEFPTFSVWIAGIREKLMKLLGFRIPEKTVYVIDKSQGKTYKPPSVRRIDVFPEGIKSEFVMKFPTARSSYSVARTDRFIYVIGGLDSRQVSLKTIEVYDTVENRVFNTEPLTNERIFGAVICHNGYLYVAGGCDLSDYSKLMTSKCYMFCFVCCKWMPVFCTDSVEIFAIGNDGSLTRAGECELTEPRAGGTIYEYENNLYIIGGFVGLNWRRNSTVDSKRVEMMVVQEDGTRCWKKVDGKLPAGKCSFGSIFYNNRLFMVGGWEEVRAARSVFSYNPADGILNRNEPSLTLGRRLPTLFIHAGELYAVYGNSSVLKCVKSAEKLGMVDGELKWTVVNMIQ